MDHRTMTPLKAMLPLAARSDRLRRYLVDRARRDFVSVIHRTAAEEGWSPEYLSARLGACDHLARVVKQALPALGAATQRRLIENLFYHQTFTRTAVAERYRARHGELPPELLLLSPSMACNLRCGGCWASEYGKARRLTEDRLDRLLVEAKTEMGIHFVVLTGGEPTLYRPLWDVMERHQDVAFMPYTNGQLIDEAMADDLARRGNVYPCLSIDGDEATTDARRGPGVHARLLRAMRLLQERGVFFGVSCTHTRANHDALVREDYFAELAGRGARLGWLFHYVPLGDHPDPALSPTPEQRVERHRLVQRLRAGDLPMVLYDFWMDGPLTNGCIGWGKRYVHVTADGKVEPCAFIHFAQDGICDQVPDGRGGLRALTLTECLNRPWLKEARAQQPFGDNLLAPCPYVDHPEILRSLTERHGVAPSHPGAEQCTAGPVYEAVRENAEAYRAHLDVLGLRVRGCRPPPAPPREGKG